jgi:hypothetical protein
VKSQSPKRHAKISPRETALSDIDVARFLLSLASLYRDKRSGNPALALALTKLAQRLNREAKHTSEKDLQQSFFTDPTRSDYKELIGQKSSLDSPSSEMTAESVSRYLGEEGRTKRDLIELASIRFAIPRSKLKRMNLQDIREAIRSALQHENSLEIIGQEAARHGATRRS